MKKNMYSLMLSGDVVSAVDRLAHAQGTSRSNLIDRILAEYLSLETPQKRVEDVFAAVAGITEGDNVLQVMPESSANMLHVKSVLNFKYNPTIRYTLEMTPDSSTYGATLRVVSRTQSHALKNHLATFFELWAQVERFCLAKQTNSSRSPQFKIADGKYIRDLYLDELQKENAPCDLGRHIGDYIQLIDESLGLFFDAPGGVNMRAFEQIIDLYNAYLEKGTAL